VRLEPEHRRLINFATTRARAFGREQFAAEIAAERESMKRELDALRDKLQTQAEDFQKQISILQRESALLKEWFAAHSDHQRAKAELAAHLRQQTVKDAWGVEYTINSTKH
jgi:Skp family chaperone for outer membrane proteins